MMSMSLSGNQAREQWRLPLVAVALLLLLLLLRYQDTAIGMVDVWYRSTTFNHAFIVPPIALWLMWRERDVLKTLQPRPMPWVLVPMLACVLLWWLGHLVTVNAATQLAMTALIVLSVPLLLGRQVTQALAFPLLFLFFAVPIGEFLTPTLMRWTADVLVSGLRLTGVPVYQEGQQLVIPSGRWAVVEACSGIRYLMASFMVGSLFAYLNYNSLRRRLTFMVISIVVPIVANWLRAYIIVMLGHLSNNEIATGVDHLVYGWVFFGIVIMGLFYLGARWSEPELPWGERAALVKGSSARVQAPWAYAVVAAVALLVLQLPWWLPGTAPRDDAGRVSFTLPETLGNWTLRPQPPVTWLPIQVGANQEVVRSYGGARGHVGVHVAYYRQQREGAKLVSSANYLLSSTDEVWNVTARHQAKTAADGETVPWRSVTMTSAENAARNAGERQRLTVWMLYWVGGHLTTSDIEAKLWQAWLVARGEPDDSAVVHLYALDSPGQAADTQLAAFAGENFDMLRRTLTQARESR